MQFIEVRSVVCILVMTSPLANPPPHTHTMTSQFEHQWPGQPRQHQLLNYSSLRAVAFAVQ